LNKFKINFLIGIVVSTFISGCGVDKEKGMNKDKGFPRTEIPKVEKNKDSEVKPPEVKPPEVKPPEVKPPEVKPPEVK